MTFDESRPFVSAEDFDATGILTGVDACASSYWWMPELYGPDGCAAPVQVRLAESIAGRPNRDQATRRTASRTTAAA
jgi:hypothetical protein